MTITGICTRFLASISVPSEGVSPPRAMAAHSSMRSAPPLSAATQSSTVEATISSMIFGTHLRLCSPHPYARPPNSSSAAHLNKSLRALPRGDSLMSMKRALIVAVVLGCLLMLARLVVPSIVERQQNHILQSGPYHASAEAAAPHRTLLVADLHADTLLWGRNLLEPSRAGSIDLPRMMAGNVGLQAFTVVSTVPRNLNIDRNDDSTDLLPYLGMAQGWPLKALNSPKQRALYQAQLMQQFVTKSNGALML